MTREEINRKISELRGVSHKRACDFLLTEAELQQFKVTKTCTCGAFDKTDWHADANWPTLLRDMPYPELGKYTDHREEQVIEVWYCTYNSLLSTEIDATFEGLDPAEAVCLAWLKWKESK